MKTKNFLKKAAAIVLVSSMVMTIPGMAATAESSARSPFAISTLWSGITSLFEKLTNRNGETEDSVINAENNSEAEVVLASNDAADSSNTADAVSTYAADGDIVYFPVTLFDYDKDEIDELILTEEARDAVESNQTQLDYWTGLYFSGGNPTDMTSSSNQLPDRKPVGTDQSETTYKADRISYRNDGDYSDYIDGTYYLDAEGETEVRSIKCARYGYIYEWTINGNTYYNEGRYFTLYHAVTSNVQTVEASGYAGYNYWTGNENAGRNPYKGVTTSGDTRGYIYSGLAENELDRNGNIQFTVPDGGIFDVNDTTSKEVYTNVGLPFEYNSDTGFYTFDSDEMAAYFKDGEAESGVNLEYSEYPAAFHYANTTTYHTGFFPFNNLEVSDTSVQATTSSGTSTSAYAVSGEKSNGSAISGSGDDAADFWFGMTANVSFTMNPNGKVTASDNSADAEFTFSGDDDVWVFIDGTLVLDLGGIHDSVSGSINFADNTIRMWSTNTDYSSGDVAGTYNTAADQEGRISQGRLFNVVDESTGEVLPGKLNTDIYTFCASDEHTLTIYYLERGAGLSNNKIQFNLPQRDSVSVSKVVSSVDSENIPLTQEQQNTVNNQDFVFTLYDGTNQPMGGQAYSLYSSAGTFLGNGSTTSGGQFTLRNGQTARFYGLTLTEDNTYYVIENSVAEYVTPAWNVQITGSNQSYDNKSGNTSQSVTINGVEDEVETIAFTCTNTLEHIDGTEVIPHDDVIVIDYGLPVEIDVLANDTWSGASLELFDISEGKFGTADVVNNKVVYTLNEQLTGVETLTYEVRVNPLNEVDGSKTAQGTIQIIPATTMYYEEYFGHSGNGGNDDGLVKYVNGNSSGWVRTGNELIEYQETGFVGTTNDSPYGSDKAYLNNQGDSDGTSMHVDTTGGAAQFSYTFTGTGTTVFARMTQDTGYVRIQLKNSDDQIIKTTYVDTKILSNNSNDPAEGDTEVSSEDSVEVLYNVPIYDNQELDYGTYTLTVTVAKAKTVTATAEGAGPDFYLDGIRIYQPIYDGVEGYDIAENAYLRDGESNIMTAQMRDKILNDYASEDGNGELNWNTENGFVTFTDTNGAMQTAEEYSSIGPKNEVYLNNGQSIMFSLANWDQNTGKIYLGIKAPEGTGTVRIGNRNAISINNTVDCYYDISSYGTITTIDGVDVVTFDITSGSDSLISITNIKVTGMSDADFVIIPKEEINGDVNVDLEAAADMIENETPAYQLSKNMMQKSVTAQMETEEEAETVQPSVKAEVEAESVDIENKMETAQSDETENEQLVPDENNMAEETGEQKGDVES